MPAVPVSPEAAEAGQALHDEALIAERVAAPERHI
jgi:hypothetical protein